MRTALIVNDKNGKTKVQHLMEGDRPFSKDTAFLSKFVKDKDSMLLLLQKLNICTVFTKDESAAFTERLLKGNKKETDYYLSFLDTDIGVELLENIILCNKKKLVFLPINIGDAWSVQNLYSINFKEGKLEIYISGFLSESVSFEV